MPALTDREKAVYEQMVKSEEEWMNPHSLGTTVRLMNQLVKYGLLVRKFSDTHHGQFISPEKTSFYKVK